MFFCLIFRTCYQQLSFKFMTTEMSFNEVTRIKDLMYWDFNILLHHSYSHLANKFPPNQRVVIAEDYQMEHVICSGQIFKTAVLINMDILRSIQCPINWKILPQTFSNEPVVLFFQDYDLMKLADNVITSMKECGIFKHLNDEMELGESNAVRNLPQILSIDDLLLYFYIWLATVGVAVLVFITELIINQIQLMRYKKSLNNQEAFNDDNYENKTGITIVVDDCSENRSRESGSIQSDNIKEIDESCHVVEIHSEFKSNLMNDYEDIKSVDSQNPILIRDEKILENNETVVEEDSEIPIKSLRNFLDNNLQKMSEEFLQNDEERDVQEFSEVKSADTD